VGILCIQVLRSSHKCGRIEHNLVSGQVGADLGRLEEIKKVCPLELVEMEPGESVC